MQPTYTPGPWSASATVLRNARGQSIASGGNNRQVLGPELEASLRLAAAAPDLLAALEAWTYKDNAGLPHEERLRLTFAAIARATGGDQ